MTPQDPIAVDDAQDLDAAYNPVDESVKALLRSHPDALFRLAGRPVEPHRIRIEDTAINVPEQRADHVFIVEEDGGRLGAVYLEYQLQPRAEELAKWFAKAGRSAGSSRCPWSYS